MENKNFEKKPNENKRSEIQNLNFDENTTDLIEEKKIILKIILDSKILFNSDSNKIESEWDDSIKEDHKFLKSNKFVVSFIHHNILRSVNDFWIIVGLLKIFIKCNFHSEEVLNTLFMIDNIIKHLNYFHQLYSGKDKFKREIDEQSTESYFNINNKFFFLLNNYKTKKGENNSADSNEIDEIYYEDFSDKRREVFIDQNGKFKDIYHKLGYFNYINLSCSYRSHDEKDRYCPYSHNNMEILYHPLNLKTRLCRFKEIINGKCHNEYCPRSHNLPHDFRYLYDLTKSSYRKISEIFRKLDLFQVYTVNYHDISQDCLLPAEFHPKTYKTIECPMGNGCRLDPKLCLNYHNLFERRRNAEQHRYSAKYCEYVYSGGKWKNPLNCPGDKCEFSHNIYEYLYNPGIFRQKQCLFELHGKRCEYMMICPYNHRTDTKDNLSGICHNSEIVEYYLKSIKEKVRVEFENFKKLQAIVDNHKCRVCKLEYNGCYVKLRCGDLICKGCCDNFIKVGEKDCACCKKPFEIIKQCELN